MLLIKSLERCPLNPCVYLCDKECSLIVINAQLGLYERLNVLIIGYFAWAAAAMGLTKGAMAELENHIVQCSNPRQPSLFYL